MAPEDLELWADSLLLKIHAITGWTVPEDVLLTVFTDQFRKKITESYPNTNPDEIEYAFRNYGTAVQDWGKQMNLSLIDQVMIPYLARRAELSKLEEQKTLPAIDAPKEDLSDSAMQEWLKDVRQKVCAGGYSFQLLPIMVYDWLVSKGEMKLKASKKAQYVQKAVEYRRGLYLEMLEKGEDSAIRTRLRAFQTMMEAGEIAGDEIEVVEALTRRMILFDYLLDLED